MLYNIYRVYVHVFNHIHTMYNGFTAGDAHDILSLEPQIRDYLSVQEKQKLALLQDEHGIESAQYLEEIIALYNRHILGVVLKKDPRPKGIGRRKVA